MRTQMYLLFLALAITFSSRANAAPLDVEGCNFVPRQKVAAMMSELPESIIGWVSRYGSHPKANVFLVGKLSAVNDTSLKIFVRKIGETIDVSSVSTDLIWESRQPIDSKQIQLKTTSAKVDNLGELSMVHYAFVQKTEQNSFLVLIHSMDEVESKKIRSDLETLNRDLTKSKVLKRL